MGNRWKLDISYKGNLKVLRTGLQTDRTETTDDPGKASSRPLPHAVPKDTDGRPHKYLPGFHWELRAGPDVLQPVWVAWPGVSMQRAQHSDCSGFAHTCPACSGPRSLCVALRQKHSCWSSGQESVLLLSSALFWKVASILKILCLLLEVCWLV